ncbi:MAG: oligosaccharide flippase family protein [Roseburia sp.]|nr:oligosaccharide flippase family protein [Roseburia sp.]MCM1277903.1 oligosaccharide flippase family protein [Robinsoniella sp.]
MRAKIFLKNGIIILAAQIFTYLMDFLCRTVFIYTLSMEFVGIKGLFSNILSILALTELGVGTVLIYSMYKPIAQKDEEKLLALLGFYKKAYTLIACMVGGIGLLLTPFLPYLIKDCPDIKELPVIYLLYLCNSVFSYLFAYKLSILQADQKLYIITLLSSLISAAKNIVQIAALYLTGNFFVYLLIQLPFTLFNNLFISRQADKLYPFIKTKEKPVLPREEKKEILKNTFAMFNHRIGATILNSTDNLIISRFIGITAVAINDNYVLIVNMINFAVGQIFSALTAGVGNLNATESRETSYKVFKLLHFASFWFYSFCTICLFLLLNPFIELIWGKHYLFPLPVVAIICTNFYIVGIRKIPLVFKESMGLLWQDRFKPLLEAALNLVISVLAVQHFGVAGVFAGTFFSMVTTSLWVEPYVLFKYGLKMSWKEFWLTNAGYFSLSLFLVVITYFAGSLYHGTLLASFFYKIVICVLLPNILVLIFFCKTKVFKGLLDAVNPKNLFSKKKS